MSKGLMLVSKFKKQSGNSPFFRWEMKATKHIRLLYKLCLLFAPWYDTIVNHGNREPPQKKA